MVEHSHEHEQADLTKNQSWVFEALKQAKVPLSAYAVLDLLRPKGIRAPLQIYRALERLIALDLVHRVESLNAFMVCQQPTCEGHDSIAFAICDSCHTVAEISNNQLDQQLRGLTKESGFQPKRSTVELHGLCEECRS